MPNQDNSTPNNPETQIVPFNFDNTQVRVVRDESGEPWFVAADVCKVLGYANTSKAIKDHIDDEDRSTIADITTGYTGITTGGSSPIAINESGLFALILSSTLPKAKQFKRWVTSEVLPSIRKTGQYAIQQIDPILAAIEIAKQTRLAQIKLENQVHIHDEQIHDHDGRLLALESGRGYVTLKGYYNKHHKAAPDNPTLGKLGKRAVVLSGEMGYQVSSVPDTTWGKVYAYHENVLEKLLGF